MSFKEVMALLRDKHRLAAGLKKWIEVIINPRFLMCFGIGWMITNGWAYIMLGIGIWTETAWMVAVATGYLAALWFPFTPEKILTVAIALLLLKKLFPNDKKTLGVLRELMTKTKERFSRRRKRRKAKKALKKTEESDEQTKDM